MCGTTGDRETSMPKWKSSFFYSKKNSNHLMPKKDSKQKIKIILLFFFGNLMVFFSFEKWKLYKKFIISKKKWSVHWSRKKYNFFFYVFSQNNFTRWCEPTKRDCSLTVCGLSSVLIVPISCLYFDTVLCSCTRYFFRTRFVFGLECFNKFFYKKKSALLTRLTVMSFDNGNELKPSGIGQCDPNTVPSGPEY